MLLMLCTQEKDQPQAGFKDLFHHIIIARAIDNDSHFGQLVSIECNRVFKSTELSLKTLRADIPEMVRDSRANQRVQASSVINYGSPNSHGRRIKSHV